MKPFEESMKTGERSFGRVLLWCVVVCTLIVTLFVSLAMPKLLEWYFDPPVSMGISCKDPIIWALQRFQLAQVIGVAVGAFLGLLMAIKLTRKSTKSV
jgi:hypothetical protein